MYSRHIKRYTKRIYMDYASITPTDPRVARLLYWLYRGKDAKSSLFGGNIGTDIGMSAGSGSGLLNPSSLYKRGTEARKLFESARKDIAKYINAHPDEIIFTGSGTEANNMAFIGTLKKAIKTCTEKSVSGLSYIPHIMVSAIEHSSILNIAKEIEKNGFEDRVVSVQYIPVDSVGSVDLDFIKKNIRPETCFISVMTMNNEIGQIQPIREIAKIVRHAISRPVFHTDAAQAGYWLDFDVNKLGVDLITFDASKMYGPRGIGLLWKRRSLSIEPIMLGGNQEQGLRPGTENIPAAVGFAKAFTIAKENQIKNIEKINKLRNFLEYGLKNISKKYKINIKINGSHLHILNASIPVHKMDGEELLFRLDARGIEVSTKSSCLRDEDESYVLQSIGCSKEEQRTAIRFSLGANTSTGDIKKVLVVISDLLSSDIYS